MQTSAQIKEQRNKLITEAGELAKAKPSDKEARAKVAAMLDEADGLLQHQNNAERLEKHAEEFRSAGRPPRGELNTNLSQDDLEKRAFRNYIRGTVTADDQQYLRSERRDFTEGSLVSPTGGGYLVPRGFDSTLHTATKAIGEIASAVRTWNTDSGEGIQVALHDPTAERFSIVSEMSTVPATDPTLNGFVSYTDTLGFSTKVSNQVIQDSAFSIDNFMSERIAGAWARTLSENIIKGNSSNFQSLRTAASAVATTATGQTTTIGYNNLLKTYTSLDPSYLPGAAWWMNSQTWSNLLGIVDTTGKPLLTSDLQGNPFKSLFGLPIRIAQSLDSPAATKIPILLGDAAASYTTRVAGPMVVRRSEDRYVEQNATLFAAFQRAGGYTTIQSSSASMVALQMAAS